MTAKQIDAMEAGPDMDRAVARIIGPLCTAAGVPMQYRFTDGHDVIWEPSTDWNDAMFAAERFGLLKNRYLIQETDGTWAIKEYIHFEGICPIARAASGPLSLCRAILNLHA